MHPLRQIAAVFQEESMAASAPVAMALSSIAARLERLAAEIEKEIPVPVPVQVAEPVPVVEPTQEEKPSAKTKDK